jgi:hypothetical protein
MATEEDRLPQSTEAQRLESGATPGAQRPLVQFRLFQQLQQRNVFRVAALYLIAVLAVALCACTPKREIRTDMSGAMDPLPTPASPTAECNVGSETRNENRRVIEDYGSYVLTFAEFDDQGWSYDGDRQLAVIRERLQAELKDPAYADQNFIIVVFVHGWHHNAHDNDCNVQETRELVRLVSQQEDEAVRRGVFIRKRRVFGIYVGWRGESVNAPLLRYATIIDRRNAAENVAKGSVRQLLADLYAQKLIAQQEALGRVSDVDRAARVSSMIVGHSFGALIVFNAVSQQLLNELAQVAAVACGGGALGVNRPLLDQVVLINPAIEASRFEPLNRIADRAAKCGYVSRHPLVTVVTADNDLATGFAFTAGRYLITLFDGYDESSPDSQATEREANVRAIGFVGRYLTHRLCLRGSGEGGLYATAAVTLTRASTADPRTVSVRAIWVVRAPPDIVDGHDGFLYARNGEAQPQPYLLRWLIGAGWQGGISPPNTCGSQP